MSMEILLSTFANNLIPVMFSILGFALLFRYLTFRYSKNDRVYFLNFARELQKQVLEDSINETQVTDVESYLSTLVTHVKDRLPKRRLRNSNRKYNSLFANKEGVSLKEYISGSDSILSGIQDEMAAFGNHFPPNYKELTNRLLNRDNHWRALFGILPIERFSKVIDVLPGILIILGVFGTFVGISMALPILSNVDFSDLEASQGALSLFVSKIAFAMSSSVVGIFNSLILTLLNTVFPIKNNRIQVRQRIAQSLEGLWQFIHAKPKGMSIDDMLPKLFNVLTSIDNKLGQDSQKRAS